MVANFVTRGAAASVLCEAMGVRLDVVDVGVEGEPLVTPAESAVNFRRDAVASLPAGDLRTDGDTSATLAPEEKIVFDWALLDDHLDDWRRSGLRSSPSPRWRW